VENSNLMAFGWILNIIGWMFILLQLIGYGHHSIYLPLGCFSLAIILGFAAHLKQYTKK
jgi:hypothetical protein